MTTIMTAIAAILATIYLSYMACKAQEIPDSISETAYIADNKTVFTTAILAFISLICGALVQKCSDNTQFLAFLTSAGLTSVAFSPNYKTEHKIMHYGGGILTLIASQLALIFNNSAQLLNTWFLFPIVAVFSPKNWVFWAELICMITIFLFIL